MKINSLTLCVLTILTGCGGGGKEEDGGLIVSNFGEAPVSGRYSAQAGVATTGLDSASGPVVVTSAPTFSEGTVSFVNAAGELHSVQVNGQLYGAVDAEGGFVLLENGSSFLRLSDANAGTYNLHGAGYTGARTSSGSMFGMVVGYETDAGNLPAGVGAFYSGLVDGVYIDDAGAGYLTSGNISLVTADFTSVDLEVSGSWRAPLSGASVVSASELDFTATGLTVLNGQYSGTFTSGGLSGDVNGRFYGPAAEETGGVIAASGAAGNYVAGFGAN